MNSEIPPDYWVVHVNQQNVSNINWSDVQGKMLQAMYG